MAYNDGLVTSPVGFHDVQRALGVSSGDEKTLCTSSLINKFARWKPLRRSEVAYTSDSTRLAAAKTVNYGTGFRNMGRLDVPTYYGEEWTHNAPRGLNGGGSGYNEFYRIHDFNGYQHNKWQLGAWPNNRGIYTIFDGQLSVPGSLISELDVISLDIQSRENSDIDTYTGLLYPKDFENCATDISQYYVGIAILVESNNKVFVFSEYRLSDFYSGNNYRCGCRATITSSIPNGALKIIPVLTQNSTNASWTESYNGSLVTLNGAYMQVTKVQQAVHLQTNVTFNLTSQKTELIFTVTNNTANPVTVNNLWCYLLSNGAMDNEHDLNKGGSNPHDHIGEGAENYLNRTYDPTSSEHPDVYSHMWEGGYPPPSSYQDELAARSYNAKSGFMAANGGSEIIGGGGTTITWSYVFKSQGSNVFGDDFGDYMENQYGGGAWAMLFINPATLAPIMREYKSF